jgi:hypothetical protein
MLQIHYNLGMWSKRFCPPKANTNGISVKIVSLTQFEDYTQLVAFGQHLDNIGGIKRIICPLEFGKNNKKKILKPLLIL